MRRLPSLMSLPLNSFLKIGVDPNVLRYHKMEMIQSVSQSIGFGGSISTAVVS